MTLPTLDLGRVRCAYCDHRAHTTEWEGDQRVPVCKAHAHGRPGATTTAREVPPMPNRTPPVTVNPRTAAAAMAVLAGARSVRAVAAATGDWLSNTHRHLRNARRLGLVAWEDGKKGTLRPGVEVVR